MSPVIEDCGAAEMKTLLKSAIGAAGYEIKKKRPDLPDCYDEDGLRTDHDHRFINDPRFAAAYASAVKAIDNDPQRHGPWRVHVGLWAAYNALRLGGDFVECGVYRGFMSSAIVSYLSWNSVCRDRRFFLFDTFSGLVKEKLTQDEIAAGRLSQFGDKYSDTYGAAVKTFRNVKNCIIVKGMVPESLMTQPISCVSYLHLDMNSAVPEVAALEHFWPKITAGGFILMDDYAYRGYEPQHVALDKFAMEVGYEILSLPTGQGLLIK
jgi:hypothetical protein